MAFLSGPFDWMDNILVGGNPDIKHRFLVSSIVHPFLICITYLVVVLWIGPAYMRNRPALGVRKLMVAYDFALALFYTLAIAKFWYIMETQKLDIVCGKLDQNFKEVLPLIYAGYIIKYVEFLDTVFMLAHKKFQMVTKLHVVHHITVPLAGFLYLRLETSTYAGIPVLFNTSIHVIMYSYYGLSALGFTKLLWLKKRITILQITQFIFGIPYCTVLLYKGCGTSTGLYAFGVMLGLAFLVMFLDFFFWTYSAPRNFKLLTK